MQLELPFLRATETSNHGTRAPRQTRERRTTAPDPVEFVRVRHARRYILRVRPDGTLRVTVPRGGSRREAEAFVRRHAQWIVRERHRVREAHSPVEWHAGSQILFRGCRVTICVEAERDGYCICYGGRRVKVAVLEDIRTVVEGDLRELARVELIPRLHELAQQHGVKAGRVTIRNQRSRWGSCARNGNIALNFRLVQMPDMVRDYIIVHELMHIRQQSHSRRFWRLVAAACPAYRDCERWLRTSGRLLF